MTTAQVIFAIALAVVALIITGFAIFVISTTMWAHRWYKPTYRPAPKAEKEDPS